MVSGFLSSPNVSWLHARSRVSVLTPGIVHPQAANVGFEVIHRISFMGEHRVELHRWYLGHGKAL